MRHKPKKISGWLLAGWLAFSLAGSYFDPDPRREVYRSDPISIGISIAISAAIMAGRVGLEYLAAKKAKVPPVDRGKLDDIRVSMPGYGEPIVKGWGRFRCAPIWVWATPIIHSTVTTPGHSGGKGPPKPPTPDTVDHIYTQSVMGVIHDGEIQNVPRIWFGNDIVWNTDPAQLSPVRYEAESATLGGTAVVTAASYASNGSGVTHLGTGGGDNGFVEFDINAPNTGDYDVAIHYQLDTGSMSFKVWLDGVLKGTVSCAASGASLIAIQTIGFAITAGAHVLKLGNDVTHSPNLDCIDVVETISFSGGSNADSRSFTGLIDPQITPPTDEEKAWPTYNQRPIEMAEDGTPLPGTSTLTANLAKWGQPQIRIYRGTADQEADPAIIADKGADFAPAWRGYALIVIEGIQVPNGQLPNVTIEVDQGTTAVADIETDLFALGGVDSSDLELSALSGLTIMGVVRPSRTALGDTSKDLQTRFQYDKSEVDGAVKAVLRNRTEIDATIPYAKLRAHAQGSEMPAQDCIITDIDPLLLPRRVNINYLDPSLDYHNNTQFDQRLSGVQYDEQSVSLSLVDNEHNMKKLASVLLYRPEMEGRTFQFETGPEFLKLVPGSNVSLPLLNATHTVRITDAKYGLPAGVCQFTGVRQAASVYSPSGFGSIGIGAESPVVPFPGNTKAIVLDGPLFRSEDAGDGSEPVLYIGMCGIGGGAWPGAFIYQESPRGSDNYIFVGLSDKPSAIGQTTDTLPSVDDVAVWDTTSELTVNFYFDPQLSSASESDVEDNPNLNLLAIKNPSTGDVECVQFKNATPGTAVSPFVAQYTLDNFLRGRFESQHNVASHSATDDVVVVDSTLKVLRQPREAIGQELKYKFITSGQSGDDARVIAETLRGNSLRPLVPTDFTPFFDSAFGHCLVEWVNPDPRKELMGESFDLEFRNAADTTTQRALVITPDLNRPLQEYVIFDPDSFTGTGPPEFIADGGVFLPDGKINSLPSAEIVGGLLVEFGIPPRSFLPMQWMSVYPESSTGDSADDALIWHTAGTFPNYTAIPEYIYPDGTPPTIDIAPGDRLGIYIRPDGIPEYHVNYAPHSKPIWISNRKVDLSQSYKVFLQQGTAWKITWMRQGPEYIYIASAQQLDNSLTPPTLPATIYARVRQRAFIEGGPPSAWLNGVFVRP